RWWPGAQPSRAWHRPREKQMWGRGGGGGRSAVNGASVILWGSETRCDVLTCVLAGCPVMDDRRMLLLSMLYWLARWLLSLSALLVRRDLSNDVELLVLRHENAV